MKALCLSLVAILLLATPIDLEAQSGKRTIRGRITSSNGGDILAYASVYCIECAGGVTSDVTGEYMISVPTTEVTLLFRYLGYNEQRLIVPPGEEQADVVLAMNAQALGEVVVEAERNDLFEQVDRPESGIVRMDMKEMRALPAIGGETDIIKVIQLLPGVTQGGEGSTSLFVRGGDADQNLILYDDATVYNVSHLFGFFSVFNSDILEDVTLYKGGFPARYGGRLSSILEVRTKDGSMDQWGGQLGVGLLSSRISVNGPVVPGKVSIMLGARRAYIDKAFKLVGLELPYHFYDLNGKICAQLSSKDRLSISMYRGYDVLSLEEGQEDSLDNGPSTAVDFGFRIGNYAAGASWRHSYSTRLESTLHLGVTSFNYKVGGGTEDVSVFVHSNIRDVEIRPELTYQWDDKTRLIGGIQATRHEFRPNIIEGEASIIDSLFDQPSGTPIESFEGAVYLHMDRDLPAFRSRVGVSFRQSMAFVKGANYSGPEPRVSYRYSLTEHTSLKASFSVMRQYMHRVSSSNVVLPTDLWYPVTERVLPQRAFQWSTAVEHIIPKINTMVSVEAYIKDMYNLTEYRQGANLVMNNDFEDELIQGKGLSKGVEFLIRRSEGRFTGWVGYTLARTERQFEGIDRGEWFPARYDRRHDLSMAMTFDVTKRITLGANFVYLSGARFTALLGNYFAPNPVTGKMEAIPVYSRRNEIKLSDSHRLDVNIRFSPHPDSEKLRKGYFNIGAYNVYARAMPYRVNLTPTEEGKFKYTQPGLFGFIFNASYEIQF